MNDLKGKAQRGMVLVKEKKDVAGLAMLWPMVEKKNRQMG